MLEYRQVLYKPYRVIYRVHHVRVLIYLIADGRRDLQSFVSHFYWRDARDPSLNFAQLGAH